MPGRESALERSLPGFGRGSTGAIPNQTTSAGHSGKMVGIAGPDRFQTWQPKSSLACEQGKESVSIMMWPRSAHWVVFALYGLLPFLSPSHTSLGAEPANPITNTIGMKLVLIPAGDFMMGSRETPEELAKAFGGKPEWFTDEQPSHRVRITKPFYLGAHEVTRGQFRQFIDDSGHQTDAEKGDPKGIYVVESVEGKAKVRLDPEGSWRKVGFEQTDEHPVVGVSWNDATAFCKWLSRKERKTYRLPTEAEWEYACRAGSTTYYFNGDDPEDLALIGNVADAKAKAQFPNWTTIRGSDGYAYTAPVGKFRANGFGLYDMHGNVWEWCADWYDAAYYKNSPSEDPEGSATGSDRVFRGGSWYDFPWDCRSASRLGSTPDGRSDFVGFRVALVPVDASGR